MFDRYVDFPLKIDSFDCDGGWVEICLWASCKKSLLTSCGWDMSAELSRCFPWLGVVFVGKDEMLGCIVGGLYFRFGRVAGS